MEPALFEGDVVVGRNHKKPKVGDIVVARHNGREIIKRVTKLTAEACYLQGDNKHASTDSRQFGAVPLTNIKAVVVWSNARGYQRRG